MLSANICRQCRAHLQPRRIAAQHSQWQSRATFISLREQRPQHSTEQTEAQAQPEDAGVAPKSDQPSSYSLFDRDQTAPARNGSRSLGRYSKHLRDGHVDAPGVQDANRADGAEEKEINYTVRIRSRLRTGGLKGAWELFERTYTSADCEALKKPSTTDIQQIDRQYFFPNILAQVIKEFCDGQGEPTVTPTAALLKYEQLGIAPAGLWVKDAIEPLTHQVMLAANGVSTTPQRDLPTLLSELISLWRLFFQCKGPGNDPLEAISTEWNLPAIDAIPFVFESNDFSHRLQEFHPKAIGSPALGFCAIYLFNLTDAIIASESLRPQAAPFLELLVRVLSGARVSSVNKHAAFSRVFQTLPEDVQVEVTREIDAAPARALGTLGRLSATANKSAAATVPVSAEESMADLEVFNLKTIGKLLMVKGSPASLDRHWRRISRDYTKDGKTSIPPKIYDAFLSGYLILHKAPRSVEVWNHMIANGVNPEMRTWVAMLDGCAKAKDLDGFNAMWQRMQSAGMEPDDHAWTTRVHGLMSFRQINLGLQTLEDMGRRWQSAEIAAPSKSKASKKQPRINDCTKPSVAVINGAISGLVQLSTIHQRKRVDYVQKIMKWATHFGVRPDTRTFNILIQMYLSAGDSATAFKILKQMELNGIEADMATHTMLITAAFENGTLGDLTDAERAKHLIRVFEELEAGGMKLEKRIYSTAIDRLLKQYESLEAVRALIEHMRSRKLSPSAHAYTSIITFYFQQTPPAIAAVDSLLQQIFETHDESTDKILFDRAIEGYAQHGEVGRMMSVLTRMSKAGNHPGFRALTAVIKALVAAGDVDRARLVVRDVQRGEGVANGGVTGAYQDQKYFLAVAEDLGVGSNEERNNDSFTMRNDLTGAQEEQTAIGMQPEPKASGQPIGAQWAPSIVQRASEQRAPEQSRPDLEPAEEDIHGFLDSGTDAEPRQW
ncbi:hypothetical protein C7974DRAFT_26337 [Boeremia exigua]|uniref:uncharacterized protein n=1 Tax=Boeremia exigua TaxID=749465 RepID=UPI001E8EA1D4|nr:uncharacterized protein C7974DRAFT_26337 [Boeremia exigua]KAH6644695.1 hypothetical protein C7974DRAFT_26337 [Boeremia exigua]